MFQIMKNYFSFAQNHFSMQKQMLPKVAIAAFLSGTLLLNSCDKVVEKLAVDLPTMTTSVDVNIPPTDNTATQQDMGSQEVHYNVDSFIKANTNGTLGINNIQSVKLKSCKVVLKDGSDADNNFQNFEWAQASFYTNSNKKPIEMRHDEPDQAHYETTLDVPNDELKDYIKGDNFTYTAAGKLRKKITHEVKATVTIEYNIKVK